MEDVTGIVNAPNGACMNHSHESHSTIASLHEPFLTFDENSVLTFEDKSTIYYSLVTLLQEEYPLNKVLQDRAVRFLKSLEPNRTNEPLAAKLVTDLVPSSTGSPSGFLESILTLLSSHHSTLVAATLSFLSKTTNASSIQIRNDLVASDLITKVFATIQPHTLPITGNEPIHSNLNEVVNNLLILANPSHLNNLGITTAVDTFNHREMIFQKVVIPSSQFVVFLISNRHVINRDLSRSLMMELGTLLLASPFHRPTLDFVLASPILIAFSSSLSFLNDTLALSNSLFHMIDWMREWKEEGPEVVRSGKQIFQTLFSEGFEDTLNQMLVNQDRYIGTLVKCYHSFSHVLGGNMR
ncbi:hypothetical protein BLNAU_10048 [Blattamonas nauphoetae]|uniref:Uncharacterized protein n=1 Tax=Blattamonas nauphoetae TaxID=2049346 RepID=A0ABQ9XTV6_9EUKA|nr:hypothetical protein BLNAU_10048 [Blattamonas nauphoetae]